MTSPGTSPGTESLGQRPVTRAVGRGSVSGVLITAAVHGALFLAVYESQRRDTPPPPAVRDVIVTKMVTFGKPREKFWLPRNVVTPPPAPPPPQTIKIATSPDAAPAPPPPVKPPPKIEEKPPTDLQRALQRAKQLARAAKEEPPEGSLTGSLQGTSNVAEIGDEYATKVHDAIHRNWTAPSGMLDEGQLRGMVALVRVHIAVDGRLGTPTLNKSSGNETFDDAAMQAVRATGQVPPMPPEVRSRFRAGVEIEFDGKDLTR